MELNFKIVEASVEVLFNFNVVLTVDKLLFVCARLKNLKHWNTIVGVFIKILQIVDVAIITVSPVLLLLLLVLLLVTVENKAVIVVVAGTIILVTVVVVVVVFDGDSDVVVVVLFDVVLLDCGLPKKIFQIYYHEKDSNWVYDIWLSDNWVYDH